MQVKTPVQEIMALHDFINNLGVHQSPIEASPTRVGQVLTSKLINGKLEAVWDDLGNDTNFATTIATQMDKRVRVDAAQTFTVAEQVQGCANLGIGNPDTDLLAVYTAAKA